MPLLSRKFLMLAVLMLSFSLRPTAFAQRCSGTAACAQSSSTASTMSGVAYLSGQFAFLLKGTLTTPGIASRATAAVGSFIADGNGNITFGEMDFTSAAGTLQGLAFTGTYTLDSDSGAGTLSLTSSKGTQSFVFYTTGGGLTPYTSGSLVETDGGPVVSSGNFYQQSNSFFPVQALYGYWRVALTGETFVSEGKPSPVFVSGNVSFPAQNPFEAIASLTMRVGSGTPEGLSRTLRSGYPESPFGFNLGRMPLGVASSDIGYPLNMVAYIVDDMHVLVISSDSPQVNPKLSGTMTRDSIQTQ